MTQIIIGLISVARDWRFVYKAMLDLHFQTIAKKHNTNILKSITKRNNVFLYHIEVRIPDGIQYVKMRRHKLNSKSICLMNTSIKS